MTLINEYDQINVSPELYKEIEADLEEYYKNNFSHFDRIWRDGVAMGYEGVLKYFDLQCDEQSDNVTVRLVRKTGQIVMWEKTYAK